MVPILVRVAPTNSVPDDVFLSDSSEKPITFSYTSPSGWFVLRPLAGIRLVGAPSRGATGSIARVLAPGTRQLSVAASTRNPGVHGMTPRERDETEFIDCGFKALDRRLFLAVGMASIYGCATPLFRGQTPDLE